MGTGAGSHDTVATLDPDGRPAGSSAGAIVGGLLGFGVGLVGGAWFGVATCGDACYEDEAWGKIILGALGGELLLVPLGVHIGNGARGNLAADVGVSAVSALSGVPVAILTQSPEMLLVTVAAQIAFTVMTERNTGRQRERLRVSLGRTLDGALALRVRAPLAWP